MAKTLEELQRELEEANAAQKSAASAYEDHVKAGYTPGESVNAAKSAYDELYGKLTSYAPYSSESGEAAKAALAAVTGRPAFSFSTDGDALYERYKNAYQAAGQKAMRDTIGAASALTGGYGNSYAASAGAQAYNDYISKMDEVVPELYKLALDRYNAEGDELRSRYELLAADDAQGYARWADDYSRLVGLASMAGDRYDAERSYDYGLWSDRGTGLANVYGMAQDAASSAANAENTQYEREWKEDERAYEREQDAQANALAWAKAPGGGTKTITYSDAIKQLSSYQQKDLADLKAAGNISEMIHYVDGLENIDYDVRNLILGAYGVTQADIDAVFDEDDPKKKKTVTKPGGKTSGGGGGARPATIKPY